MVDTAVDACWSERAEIIKIPTSMRISWSGHCPENGYNVRLTANAQKSGIL